MKQQIATTEKLKIDEEALFDLFVGDDKFRPQFHKPFLQDGYVVATNANILIRVRQELLKGEYAENSHVPTVSKVFSYSGGKDSDVILELAKMGGIPYRAIYKNTTIDPPGTIKHCREKGVKVFVPKINFFDLVKKKGTSTMRARFCCEVLKGYKVLDHAVQGIRRCESSARAKRYNEPTVCRIYGGKKNHVEVFLPILEWTDEDVAQFIAERGIKCHPLYYDEHGNFHVERRLGCIGCPLRSDRGKADFLAYPRFLKRLIQSEQIYLDTHPHVGSVDKFDNNAYNILLHNLFFDSYEGYHNAVTGGLFPEAAIDAKAFLEDYFKIDLTINTKHD